MLLVTTAWRGSILALPVCRNLQCLSRRRGEKGNQSLENQLEMMWATRGLSTFWNNLSEITSLVCFSLAVEKRGECGVFVKSNSLLAVKGANQKKNPKRWRLLWHSVEMYAQGHSRNKAGEPDFQMPSKAVQVYSDEWVILSPVCNTNRRELDFLQRLRPVLPWHWSCVSQRRGKGMGNQGIQQRGIWWR